MIIDQKIGQAAKWASVTEIITKLITPITNMFLARLLIPEAFGVVATITMVISFAEVFTDAGFQKYIVQHDFPDEQELDKSTNVAFWTNLGISCFICTIIFLFRHQVARMVGNPDLGNSISIASTLIIIAAFSSIQTARYRRALDFKTLFYVRIVTSLIPLVVTVPLAFFLRNYWALLTGTFASQLCNAIILTIRSKWKPRLYYNFELFKEMFSFSAWTMLESISIWVTSYVDILFVGRALNEYYLGIYKVSMSTVNSCMIIITGAVLPVLFSGLSRYQNDDDNFKRIYYQFLRFTSILVIPMGVGIFLYRELVTNLLLGAQWGEASGFVGLWGLTSAFTIVFAQLSDEVYRSKGKPKVSFFLQLIHLTCLIPTILFSIQYGYEKLYIARSLIRLESVVASLCVMHFAYRITISKVIYNTLPAIVSAAVMGIVGYFMVNSFQSMIAQLFSIFICIFVYFAVLFLVFPNTRNELMQMPYFKRK